jgi:signal transduction histidine kinase
LVDDDDAFAAEMVQRLESSGFVPHHVGSAEDAVGAMDKEVPDLLVVDRGLPGVDGFALCRTVKANPRTHFIPVIGVSGDVSEDTRFEAVKAGFDHWLHKPIEIDELVARANVLVRTSALYRATATKTESLMQWHDWVRFLVHDLRNPVSVAMGNLAFALKEIPSSADLETVKALEEARYELGRVTSMLQDMLDTDRLQRGALTPRRVFMDLAVVVRAAVAATRVITEAKKTRVEVEVRGDARLVGDRALIERTLANLIGNGVRFSRKAPVTVDIEGAGDSVVVRVKNDGPGIPLELQERLFEPWVRMDHQGGSAQGTGLGLGFCRLVIDRHGGMIWLEHYSDGNVVFAFRLPRTLSSDPSSAQSL